MLVYCYGYSELAIKIQKEINEKHSLERKGTEEMVKKWGVPLPAGENVQFLIVQKDFSLGKPFD